MHLINIKHKLEKEDEDILRGACVENYGEDNFWICCDFSEKNYFSWFNILSYK
jgi:hypothetical protein